MSSDKQVLAMDVGYYDRSAKAVGVLFNWDDSEPSDVITAITDSVEEYSPGEFYKRELPCLMKVIEQLNMTSIDTIIIDGYVTLDDNGKAGLGLHLWHALDKKFKVIGVAKTSYHNNRLETHEVIRGQSKKPLFVTAVGLNKEAAAILIKEMKGTNRIPDILKTLDTLTKE